MTRSLVLLASLLLLVLAAVPSRAADDAPEIVGETAVARVASAREMALKDPDGLGRALIAVADAKPKKDAATAALDFLVEYLVGESSRALRLLALDSAARIDAEGAAERLRAHAVPDDALKAALAAEALGYVGGKEDVETLVTLARLNRLDIAVPAIRSLARIGDKKSVETIVDVALTHERTEIGDECAWALQDFMKKQKSVLAKLKKGVGKDSSKSIRYETIAAILADEAAPPHAWSSKSLEKLRKLARDAPAEIAINSKVKQRVAKAEAAVKWLRENLPAHEYSLRVGAASIDFPVDKSPQAFLDRDSRAVGIPIGLRGVSYLKQSEGQIAYHVLRSGTVLLDHAIGNPTWGRRGWHNAVFDTWDVCKIAGLYSVADGVSRHGLLDQIYGLQSPPWRGE